MISSKKVNDNVEAVMDFGRIEGPYYDEETPEEEFDTEKEAIEHAYKKEKYANWLILPLVKFDNFKNQFMKSTTYYKRKIQICQSKKLTDQQKESKKFNLWADYVHESVKQSRQ